MGDLAVQLDYTGLDIKSTFTIWLITTVLQHISYLLSLDTWWAFSLYNQWSPISPHHLPVLTLRSRNLKNLVNTHPPTPPLLLTSIKSVLLVDTQNRDDYVFTNKINNATGLAFPPPPWKLSLESPSWSFFWECMYLYVDTQKWWEFFLNVASPPPTHTHTHILQSM